MKQLPDSIFNDLTSVYCANGKYTDGFPDSVLEIIRKEKLFKLFLPESLGGRGFTLQETLNVIQRCAYINGSLGWLVQIGNGGNYFAAYVNENAAQELFAPENAVLAGSGAVTGIATRVDGGYRISGRWKYASGSTYASFFTFSAKVEGSDQVISGCLMPDQVNVIDDWKSIGMRFTTTNSFTAENQFVPDKFVFHLSEQKSYRDISIFSFPFFPFAQSFFLNIQYGLLRRIMDETLSLVNTKKEEWNRLHPDRAGKVLSQAHVALMMLPAFKSETENYLAQIETFSGEERDKLVAACDKFARAQNATILAKVQEHFMMLGMDVLFESHPINIAYRDMMTCGQHSLLNTY